MIDGGRGGGGGTQARSRWPGSVGLKRKCGVQLPKGAADPRARARASTHGDEPADRPLIAVCPWSCWEAKVASDQQAEDCPGPGDPRNAKSSGAD